MQLGSISIVEQLFRVAMAYKLNFEEAFSSLKRKSTAGKCHYCKISFE